MAEDPTPEVDLTSGGTEGDGLLERLADIADDVFALPADPADEPTGPALENEG